MGRPEAPDDALLSELRGWGGSTELSAFEAVMWRAEIDPRLRSTTTSVLILDRCPDWERFVEGHRWVVAAVPRFRQHIVEPAFGVGLPVWAIDPDFDLDHHLRRERLTTPGTERQLFDLAQTLAMAPFDRTRPPWEATLVEGLEGGQAAYILKLHHATSDGLGIIQLLTRVLGRDREPMERPTLPVDAPSTRTRQTPARLAADRVRRGLLSLPHEAASTVSGITRVFRNWAADPGEMKQGLAYLASAKKVLGTKPVRGSGLLKKRSLLWRFDGIEIPLASLKAAARAAEASLNDVFLAGLIGGFRRYHEEMGVAIGRMPIGFPISIRTERDPMGGNKFAGSQYAAPVSEKDPIARIRHIQSFVRATRAEPALDVLIRLMPVVSRLPLAAITSMIADFTVTQDAQVSNVPGIAHPVYLAGARITHFWPFAPVPGCGMMIVMMSHDGRCCIGINGDRAAVTEPELLVECLREGLDEILALAVQPVETSKPARPVRKGQRKR